MVKCGLHNVVSYWAFSFKPNTVLRELERLFSNFIWNNKMHGWKWADLYRQMGIRRPTDINQASGVRLVWRLGTSSWKI